MAHPLSAGGFRPPRERPWLVWLSALFFLSGASALTYQVLWLRLLSTVFGVTVYAGSTVLASFMAGLALGSLLGGRLGDRTRHPLAVFGGVELLIGIVALTIPTAFDAARHIYVWESGWLPDSAVLRLGARFLSSFVLLLLPSVLMGSTLPLIVKSSLVSCPTDDLTGIRSAAPGGQGAKSAHVGNMQAMSNAAPRDAPHGDVSNHQWDRTLGRSDVVGPRVGLLYGANTAGAITGCLVTGFYLIGALGIRHSIEVGAGVNFLVGATAIWLAKRSSPADPTLASQSRVPDPRSPIPDPQSPIPNPQPPVPNPQSPLPDLSALASAKAEPHYSILLVTALSGFAALALELVWFRILVLFTPATTYAYTAMLAAVLGGIAAGSLLIAPTLARTIDWVGALAVGQIGTAVAVVGSAAALFSLYGRGIYGETVLQASVLAILPASLLMGMAFPIAARLWIGEGPNQQARASNDLGVLYAVNVCASVLGSIVGGFLLLPWLGSRASLIVISALYVVAGAILLFSERDRRYGAAAVMTAAFVWFAVTLPDPVRTASGRRNPPEEQLFWREEGVQTTASVHVRPMGGRVLYLNGLHQANDSAGMIRTHREIGLLPMLVHPDPRDALVVGLGGGATAGIMSQHTGTHVDIVELSDSVVRSADWFTHVNFDLLRRPNVRVRVDDGRDYLLHTSRRYDVVTADLIQPGHAGAGQVYSREYFAQIAHALKPGGLVLQWIGQRPDTQYKLIARTFMSVFPETTLWVKGTLLLGSREPQTIDRAAFDRKLRDEPTLAAMKEIGVSSLEDLIGMYTAGPAVLRAFVGQGPLLTDDRPWLEYYRSLPAHDPPIDFSMLTDPRGPKIVHGRVAE